MTFEEKLLELLQELGMFSNQAEEVLEMVKKDKANESMDGRWADDISDYPDTIIKILWFGAKYTALAYIDENCPKAWFRPMFESELKEEVDTAPAQ